MSDSDLRDAFLLLGANIEPERNVPRAIRQLGDRLDLRNTSTLYETEPVGISDQPPFLNVALLVRTDRSAEHLKHRVLRPVEDVLGRDRSGPRNGPRRIDVDIILFGDLVQNTEDLRIPDPDLLKHPHVAVPIAELDPDRPHPVNSRTLRSIADDMDHGSLRKRNDIPLNHPPSGTSP